MNKFNLIIKLELFLESLFNKKELDAKYKVLELDSINKFINTLSELKHCNFTLFINNLKDLDITEINKNFYLYLYSRQNNMNAWYDNSQNKIFINLNKFYIAIYHELLHAASAQVNSKNIMSGFSYYNQETSYDFGKALNEGYTQLLTDRYFVKNDIIYKLYKHVAYHLEIIIGKETMERLYFKADLVGLYIEINKYNVSIDRFNDFIFDLDFIMHKANNSNLINKYKIIKKMIHINEFLIFAYLEKLKLDNNIDKKQVISNIKEYVDSLSKIRIYYKDNGPLIDKINLKELENIMLDILDIKEKKLIK